MKRIIFGFSVGVAVLALVTFFSIQLFIDNSISDTAPRVSLDASIYTEKELIEKIDDGSSILCYTPEDSALVEICEGSNIQYVNNMIEVSFESRATEEDRLTLVKELEGELIGVNSFLDAIQIRIAPRSLEELRDLCSQLEQKELVKYASYDISQEVSPCSIPNDPFEPTGTDSYSRKRWDHVYTVKKSGKDIFVSNWAWQAIDADIAWDYSNSAEPITIGVLDAGFADCKDYDTKYTAFSTEATKEAITSSDKRANYHGSSMVSIIASKHNNNLGIAGMMQNVNIVKGNVASQTTSKGFEALLCHMLNDKDDLPGAKVINCSFGVGNGISDQSSLDKVNTVYSKMIANILEKGRETDPSFDFLIVKSAGNGQDNNGKIALDAARGGFFNGITADNCYVPSEESGLTVQDIIDRIVIVGGVEGCDNSIRLVEGYNRGSTLTILAPAKGILAAKGNNYNMTSGTSPATAFVSGTAGLIWQIAPSLSAAEVKQILIEGGSSNMITLPPLTNLKDRDNTTTLPAVPVLNAGKSAKLAYESQAKMKETESGFEYVLRSLSEEYGVIATINAHLDLIPDKQYLGLLGTDKIPNEQLSGLLAADIYDYDNDDEDELFVVRIDPYEYPHADAVLLSMYEKGQGTTPAAEEIIPFPAWTDDYLAVGSIHFFRYQRNGSTSIGIDFFYDMNTRAFGVLECYYNEDGLFISGTECDEFESGAYVLYAGNDYTPERDYMHIIQLPYANWITNYSCNWENDYSQRNNYVDDYLRIYLENLKSDRGLVDNNLRAAYGTNSPGGYNITYKEGFGGNSQNFFHDCTLKPSEHYNDVSDICGIAAPLTDIYDSFKGLQLIVYDSTGHLIPYR